MSSVDNRIVNMHFDNQQFQRGIAESNAALSNFDKNLESLSGNSSGLSALIKPVEAIASKFTWFGDLGRQVMQEINSSIVQIGKSFLDTSSMLINPISKIGDGFSEYEQTINATQTLLNGVRKEFDTDAEALAAVNAKLDELNAYSDQTIYKFGDMTGNITKFTNAGVKLDDSVMAIQGIANLAALSGANTEQAAHAMYNFGQALGTGVVKLQDWKSISNASMDTVEFKEYLLEAAVAAGTVVKVGDKYKTVTTNMKGDTSEALDLQTMFTEGLQYQWVTTEVLIDTLTDYADTETEIGKKAFAAAKEVKTFSMLIDTLGESLGSGWAASFRIIFGDLNEAKELWTSVSETLGGVVDASTKARISMLTDWKEAGGREAIIGGLAKMFSSFGQILGTVGKAFREVFPPTTGQQWAEMSKSFENLMAKMRPSEQLLNQLTRIFKGLFSVLGIGKDIVVFFGTAIGKLFSVLSVPVAQNGIISTIIEFVASIGDWLVSVDQAIDGAKLFEQTMLILEPVFTKVKTAYASMVSFLKQNPLIQGLITGIQAGIKDVIDWIVNLSQKISDAFCDFFGIASPSKLFFTFGVFILKGLALGLTAGAATLIGGAVVGLAAIIIKGFTKINLSDSIGTNIKTVLNDIYSTMLSFSAKLAAIDFSPIDAIKNKFNEMNQEGTIVGNLATAFNNFMAMVKPVFDWIKRVFGPTISLVIDKLKSLSLMDIGAVFAGKGIYDMAKGFAEFASQLSTAAGLFVKPLSDIVTSFAGLGKSFTGIFDQVGNTLQAFQGKIKAEVLRSIAISVTLLAAAIAGLSFLDPKKLGVALGAITVLIGELVAALKGLSMIGVSGGGFAKLVGVGISIMFMASALSDLSEIPIDSIWSAIGALTALMAVLGGFIFFAGGGKLEASGFQLIAIGIALKLFAGSVTTLSQIQWTSLVKVGGFLGGLAIAVVALSESTNAGAFKELVSGFTQLALGLVVLVAAIKLFAGMDMATLMTSLVGIGAAIILLGASLHMMPQNGTTGLLGIAIGLTALLLPIKLFSMLDIGTLVYGIIGVGGAILIIGAAMHAIPAEGGAGLLGLALSMTLMMVPIKVLGNMKWENLKQGLLAMGTGLIAMFAVVETMQKSAKEILAVSASLLMVAAALTILLIPIVAMGVLPWSIILGGLTLLGGTLGALVLALNFFPKASTIKVVAAGLLKLSISIGALMAVVVIAGLFDFQKTLIPGFLLLGGVLTLLALALNSMPSDLPKIAKNMLLVSAAIGVLMGVIKVTGDMDFTSWLQGLGSMAGTLGIIFLALKAFPSKVEMMGFAAGIAAIGAAMLVLSLPLVVLGKLPWQGLLAGGVALAAMLGGLALAAPALAVAGTLLTPFGVAIAAIGAGALACSLALRTLVETFVYVVEQLGRFGRWLKSWWSDEEELPAVKVIDNSGKAIEKSVDEHLNPQVYQVKSAEVMNKMTQEVDSGGKKLAKSAETAGKNTNFSMMNSLDSLPSPVKKFIEGELGEMDMAKTSMPGSMDDIMKMMEDKMVLDPTMEDRMPEQLKRMMENGHMETMFGTNVISNDFKSLNTNINTQLTKINIKELPEKWARLFEATSYRFNDANGKMMKQVYNLKAMVDEAGNIDTSTIPEHIRISMEKAKKQLYLSKGPYLKELTKLTKEIVDTYGKDLNPEYSAKVTKEFLGSSIYVLDKEGNKIPEALGRITEEGLFVYSMPLEAAQKAGFKGTLSDFVGKDLQIIQETDGKMIMGTITDDWSVAYVSGWKLNQPKIEEAVKEVVEAPVKAIDETTGEAEKSSADLGSSILGTVGGILTGEAGGNIGETFLGDGGLLGKISSKKTEILGSITNLGEAIPGAFKVDATTFSEPMEVALTGLEKPIEDAKATIGPKVTELGTEVKTKATELINEATYTEIGESIPSGLSLGIKNGEVELLKDVTAMAQKAVDAAKATLDSNSPSKVFIQIGKDVDLGLAQGVAQNIPLVTSAVSKAGDAATDTMQSSISNLGHMTVPYIEDSNPTITPVLDLSQVESNAKAIPKILGAVSNVKANAEAASGSVRKTQPMLVQNGAGTDVNHPGSDPNKRYALGGDTNITNNFTVSNENDARVVANKIGAMMSRYNYARGAIA